MKRLLPHLLVLLLGALQIGIYQARHLDSEDLARLADSGTPHEKVKALHILTNRGSTPHTNRVWNRETIQGMISAEEVGEALLADFAYTVDICRMVRPVWQDKKISSRLKRNDAGDLRGETFTEWLRHFLLYRRKVAGRHMGAMLRLKNDELRWLLHAIGNDEEAFDQQLREDVLENIFLRQTQANMSRTNRMALPDKEGKRDRRNGLVEPARKGNKLPGER